MDTHLLITTCAIVMCGRAIVSVEVGGTFTRIRVHLINTCTSVLTRIRRTFINFFATQIKRKLSKFTCRSIDAVDGFVTSFASKSATRAVRYRPRIRIAMKIVDLSSHCRLYRTVQGLASSRTVEIRTWTVHTIVSHFTYFALSI